MQDSNHTSTRGTGKRGPRGGADRQDRDKPEKNEKEKPQDKNSWIYKYHNMEKP